MKPQRILLTALAIGAGVTLASPTTEPHQLRARNIVTSIQPEYDFVVVGGGLAGLVLGGRLSEDSNHTVLVLEAGEDGDDYRDRIDVPGYAYYQSLWETPLNWQFTTVPQAGANNSACPWPRGKTLGGSSAINGLYLNRPAEMELDTWQGLLGNMEGADNWSWKSFFAAMKKSETFGPAADNIASEGDITWNPASHGTDGPIHYSYPGWTFPIVGQWATAVETVGIADSGDTYGGENWGAYVATSAINPANWTRSHSKTGYLDPLPNRPNYDVLCNSQVTRVLFDSAPKAGKLTANAVEYTPDNGATKLTVKVRKEVILAGGSVGSPTVLQYSGVGPKDVLTAAGVKVISELPGVGQHLQDHATTSTTWSTDQPTAGSLYADDPADASNPAFLSFVNSAVAYVNATTLFGDGVAGLQSTVLSYMNDYAPDGIYEATVMAGYKTIYETTANKYLNSPLGVAELVLGDDMDGAIRVGPSLQHPFSQGRIWITTNNPMDYPQIDPAYFKNPIDVQIQREALKLTRRLAGSAPMSSSVTEETWPGPYVQSDQDWENWLRGAVSTEYHPSSTCAMLPKELGGVVDANLRVYGLANVRVADASVPPMAFSCHLMGSTYGLAEQASNIIRADWQKKITPTSTKSKTQTKTKTKSHSATGTAKSTAVDNNSLATVTKSSLSTTNTISATGAGNTVSPLTTPMSIFVSIAACAFALLLI